MTDEYYMKLALKEAKKAYLNNDVPVGCIVVKNDRVISKGYNKREKNNNVLDHAEMIAIRTACIKIGSWKLEDCTMYVTLEPCQMCKGAIIESKIKKVIYATSASGEHKFTNEYQKIDNKMLETESSNIIKLFFNEVRNK